jgi:hypothetical protein
MMRWLRRLLLLGLLGGGGFAGYNAWKRKQQGAVSDAPSWPPFESPQPGEPTGSTAEPPGPAAAAPVATATTTDSAARPNGSGWVDPVDGQCPDGYPVKANDNSGIFHVPGGRFYARTVPERCYANAADAVADGYRPAKA